MADIAMEIWGKAAGGREAAAHLVLVCCVCVLSVCVMFYLHLTCRLFGLVSGCPRKPNLLIVDLSICGFFEESRFEICRHVDKFQICVPENQICLLICRFFCQFVDKIGWRKFVDC